MKRLLLIGLFSIGGAAATAGAQGRGTAITPKQAPVQSPSEREIAAQYRPPKNMCRIWLKDVPAARQPAPTDCASAVKNVPANGRVIFGETEEAKEKGKPDPRELPGAAKALTGKVAKPPLIRKPPL